MDLALPCRRAESISLRESAELGKYSGSRQCLIVFGFSYEERPFYATSPHKKECRPLEFTVDGMKEMVMALFGILPAGICINWVSDTLGYNSHDVD